MIAHRTDVTWYEKEKLKTTLKDETELVHFLRRGNIQHMDPKEPGRLEEQFSL